ncbi:MAG TPA: saccharopine dehydrogenase C-terminal domain-containing protein [Longimicrobiales bacterium]|nr:saccharopine dehydrogenase C-terminal domain-containing protein [Longimicrobiales bacterium]
MKMLVLGAGLQGSACTFDLLRSSGVERVVLADLSVDELPPYLDALRSDSRLAPVAIDAREEREVLALMRDADACMNALPYYFNFDMARLAAEAGCHYADLGGNTEIVFRQLELDAQAKAKGLSIIPDCGLAPGMVNILAAAGMASLEEVEAVRILVGGLPQNPEPPLNYQIVYSIEGVLDYYTTQSWVLRDGELVEVEALSEVEPVLFPEPIGELEAFHTAGGLSTMAWTHRGKVRGMEYKTLRYPGHADLVRTIRELGLLSLEPLRVGEQDVVPRDVFIAAVEPRLRKPGSPDLVALRVEVEGSTDGADLTVVYELVDRLDPETGVSAMERTTGYSLSITGQMQVDGRIATQGAFTPDRGVPADHYMQELARRGVRIEQRTERKAAL